MSQSLLTRAALIAFKAVCTAVVTLSIVFTIWAVGPVVETRWRPVVSKLRMTALRQNSVGESQIWVQYTKLRDCEYRGITWLHRLPNGVLESVYVSFANNWDTISSNRPKGVYAAGPWTVNLSSDELLYSSYAILYHRCHPLWLSRTEFYP